MKTVLELKNKTYIEGGAIGGGVERGEGEHAREEGCENSQEPRGNFVRRHETFPI